MSMLRFLRRARWDDERARELEAHLAIEVEENLRRGMTSSDARDAARRKLGNLTRIREEIYEMNSLSAIETARIDLRDALRQLRRRPLVSALALVLLTIGIGASAAAFSVAYGVLMRPLPYSQPERLAVLWAQTAGQRGQISLPDFYDLRSAVPFAEAAALTSGRVTLSSGANGEADRVMMVQAEAALLPLLGTRPMIGRLPIASDEGRSVAVISERLWRRMFQADPAIVGRPINISGSPYSIIGVFDANFDFELTVPAGAVNTGFTIKDVDLWTPFNLVTGVPLSRQVSSEEAIVRLKPGETLASTQTALDVVSQRLAAAYPDTNRDRRFVLRPLRDQVVEAKSPIVMMGLAGALLLLVIACANVASVYLGDLPERRRDFALRAALGAGGARLIRQLIIESGLLAAAGSVLGLIGAQWAVTWLKSAADLPRPDAIRFDLPVTAAIVVTAMAVSMIARLAPLASFRGCGARLQRGGSGAGLPRGGRGAGLPRGGRGAGLLRGGCGAGLQPCGFSDLRPSISTYSTSAPRLRRTLIGVQVALALVLSSTALLLGVSLQQLIAVDPGFAPSHAVAVRVSAYSTRYRDKGAVTRFVYDLVDRLRAVPGVVAAAAGQSMPLAGEAAGTSIAIEGRPLPVAERPTAGWFTVTPGYFHALGVSLVKGREFATSDRDRAAHQTIINETLARQLFGSQNPIGRRLSFGPDSDVVDWHEIVGVVSDVHQSGLATPPTPAAYDLFGQHWGRSVYLVVRGQREPYALVPTIRQLVRQVDPEAPVFDIRSLDDVVAGAVAPRRLATGFAVTTAAISVLLVAIGLYGLLASSVAARTRELGIRRALGSSTRAIVELIVGEAAALAIAGVVAGAAIALAIARPIQAQLFAVQATDLRVLIAAATGLAAVAAIASYLPARRAASVDPAVALRDE